MGFKSINLFLMTEKGYTVLRKAIDNGMHLAINFKVIISSDPNVKADYSKSISKLCSQHNIPCFTRSSFNLTNESNNYCVAIGWRWLIEDCHKLIIFHDSILPRYRGFSPLVNCLINGEKEIGVTAIFASKDYDTGPIIDQKKISIEYPLLIQSAIEMMSELYADLACELFNKISKGEILNSTLQKEELATYSLWRDEEDYFIDWSQSAEKIKRTIHALGFPFKGAASIVDESIIRLLDAEVVSDVSIENRDVGKVIFYKEGLPVIVCGNGLLLLKKMANEDGSEFNLKKFRTRFTIKNSPSVSTK